MHQTVEHGVSQRGVAKGLRPMLKRQLAGHQGGASPRSVFQQCEQVASVFIAAHRQAPIVEEEQSGCGQRRHACGVPAIAFGHRQLLEESRQT